jgi:predicted amidophosphoribosyltransferase
MPALKSDINKIKNYLLDLFFPKYCLSCGKENFYICPECFSAIAIQKNIHCFLCGRRSPTGYVCKNCREKNHPVLNGLLVASDWSNLLLRQIIYEYKYRFVKELSEPLSKIMIKFLETCQLINLPTDQLILIPVPLHPHRLLWRGFNQAEFLAKKISAHFNWPLFNDVLIRCRHTLPQMDIKSGFLTE